MCCFDFSYKIFSGLDRFSLSVANLFCRLVTFLFMSMWMLSYFANFAFWHNWIESVRIVAVFTPLFERILLILRMLNGLIIMVLRTQNYKAFPRLYKILSRYSEFKLLNLCLRRQLNFQNRLYVIWRQIEISRVTHHYIFTIYVMNNYTSS